MVVPAASVVGGGKGKKECWFCRFSKKNYGTWAYENVQTSKTDSGSDLNFTGNYYRLCSSKVMWTILSSAKALEVAVKGADNFVGHVRSLCLWCFTM